MIKLELISQPEFVTERHDETAGYWVVEALPVSSGETDATNDFLAEQCLPSCTLPLYIGSDSQNFNWFWVEDAVGLPVGSSNTFQIVR